MKLLAGMLVLVTLTFVASSRRFWRFRRMPIGAALTTGGWLMVGTGFLLGPFGVGLIDVLEIQDPQVAQVSPAPAGPASEGAQTQAVAVPVSTQATPEAQVSTKAETSRRALEPLVLFLLGWVGLMVGLNADRRLGKLIPPVVIKLAVFDTLASCLIIGTTTYVVSHLWNLHEGHRLSLALLFGVAAVGWSAEIRSLRVGSALEQPAALRYVRAVAGVGSIFALAVYGLLLGLERFRGVLEVDLVRQLMVALVIGLSIGVMGMWLMRLIGRGRAEFILVLVALVSLIVGAAMTLGSSPLFVALLSGAVIVNLPHPALDRFKRVILDAEQPVAMALMLMAGLMADPRIGLDGCLIVVALVLMRAALKLGVIRRSTRQSVGLDSKQPILAGLMRQSPLAMALAVAYAVTVADAPVITGVASDANIPPVSGGKVLAMMIMVGLFSETWPFIQRWSKRDEPTGKEVGA